ncbi:hypothetical protein GHT06_020267 [Daphnia sinensis]|uniref:HAT C-terminal dimerisation domain-containing protein n=1 Tax=Daphnia sinensis TaxID=1820382 RepID=A0AAD5L3C9_9CRUS|nr:hypothetical protein GHT06_020267 [Daphnia sinensis]
MAKNGFRVCGLHPWNACLSKDDEIQEQQLKHHGDMEADIDKHSSSLDSLEKFAAKNILLRFSKVFFMLLKMADNRDDSICEEECTGIANVMQLLNEDEEELTDVTEAASLETSTYDAISADLLDSPIILPTHLRCASHTLNLIASVDIDLANFDHKTFPKRNALRQALSKMTALWNKIGRSISAAEKCKEGFGIVLQTPKCPARWNSLYDSLSSFLKNYKSLDVAHIIFRSLSIPYLHCVKPLAAILDIFQGEKGCFLGIGIVLPLLTKLKKQLNQRMFPNLGPIRDKILSRVQDRFGHLFIDENYLIAACTHPFFKTNWIEDSTKKEHVITKLKLLLSDAESPLSEKSASSTEDFLSFATNNSTIKPNEVDYFLADKDVSMEMLNRYPQIKSIFIKHNTAIPTSAPVERLFSQAALVLTVRRNKLSGSFLEILILFTIW